MQQCGDDEEFLKELLADLRSETDTQMQKIEEVIRVRGLRDFLLLAYESFVCKDLNIFGLVVSFVFLHDDP